MANKTAKQTLGFKDIGPGDRVTIMVPSGIGRNGQEYKEATGTVNPLLMFQDRCVLNMGGRHGNPQVCNEMNFVRIARKAKSNRTIADVPAWA